ncbi:hypothetical protein PQR63_20825 [Herbaspirillum rhizosphaerae]|uniref:Uncharacterized protein n=1 Tax=Herbaspirillum rhizosphaerae TaxID=346179 RepID=A0ABW8ZDK1_9BURK
MILQDAALRHEARPCKGPGFFIGVRMDIRKVVVRDSGYPQIQASASATLIFKYSFESRAWCFFAVVSPIGTKPALGI